MAVFVLLCIISSIFFMAHEHFHECHGGDCPICLVIQLSEQNIKLLSFSMFFFAVSVPFFFMVCHEFLLGILEIFVTKTLVSQKIRLNE